MDMEPHGVRRLLSSSACSRLAGCGFDFRPALGMQLKVWLVRKHPSSLGVQLKYLVYKNLRKFIVLSAVAALAVSLSRRQNGKNCDGNEEERARSLARKRKRRQRA